MVVSATTFEGFDLQFTVAFTSRFQLSDCTRVYFFATLSDAVMASAQLPIGMKCDVQRKAIWTVTGLRTKHLAGHYAAVLEHEKNFTMTYQLTEEARQLHASGAAPAAIIAKLTSQGARGFISKGRIQSILALLDADSHNFTYTPAPAETQMQALIRMLAERQKRQKDIKFIYCFRMPQKQICSKSKMGTKVRWRCLMSESATLKRSARCWMQLLQNKCRLRSVYSHLL
jgi:hypothetical protein